MNKILLCFTLAAGLMLTGCSQFSPISAEEALSGIQSAKSVGTCDRKAVSLINLCTELVGSDYSDPEYLEVLQTNCESTGGVFSTANCDHTGSVGTCYVQMGQPNEARTTYYPIQYTAASASADCSANAGAFIAN